MPVGEIWRCSPALTEQSSLEFVWSWFELVRPRDSPSCRWLQYLHFDAGNYCLEKGVSKKGKKTKHLLIFL